MVASVCGLLKSIWMGGLPIIALLYRGLKEKYDQYIASNPKCTKMTTRLHHLDPVINGIDGWAGIFKEVTEYTQSSDDVDAYDLVAVVRWDASSTNPFY